MRSRNIHPLVSMFVALTAVLVLWSCGGGSSGSEGIQVSGSASLSFPKSGGEIVGTTTAVVGTATGDVDEILVNGIPATSDDGFQNWRTIIPLAATSTTIEIVARAQGVEVDRSTRVVNNQEFPLARIDKISPEVNGVYAAWTTSVSAVTRVDRGSGQRARVILPPGLGGTTLYSIVDIEFDPGRNQAIILETSQGPLFITVDFDDEEIVTTPFPAVAGEVLKEIEYDSLGDLLILRTELNPPGPISVASRIWTLHLGSQALTLVSDENSPGAAAYTTFKGMSWERTYGKLYAVASGPADIVEIDLVTGGRTLVFDFAAASGVISSHPTGTLVAVANPLRFCIVAANISSTTEAPILYDHGTMTRSSMINSGLSLPPGRDIAQAAGDDLLLIAAGRIICKTLSGGQLTTEKDLRIGSGYGHSVSWFHPAFDSTRRRLVGGDYSAMSDLDPETGIRTLIPDTVAPLLGQSSYSDTTTYDAARDSLIYTTPFGIGHFPAGGGSRTEAIPVIYAQLGLPVWDEISHCYWWAWRDYYGDNSHFKVTRYSPAGPGTVTVSSLYTVSTAHRYGFDLANGKVYCVGSSNGMTHLLEFDLVSGSPKILGTDTDGGPEFASATSIFKLPDDDRLIILTKDGILSVDTVSETRMLIEDISLRRGAVTSLIGMTYDERDRVLYLTAFNPTPTIMAYDLNSNTLQVLAR